MNQTEFRIRCVYVDNETEEQPVDGQTAANQASNVLANLEWAIGDGLLTAPDDQLLIDDHYLSYQVFDTDAKERYTGPPAESEPGAHDAVTNLCGIETRQEAVLSIGHLKESTVEYLESMGSDPVLTLCSGVSLVAMSNDLSIIIYPMSPDAPLTAPKDFPELDKLIETLFKEYGFDSICFDRDANEIDGFPVFDW